ncbi:MAG: hypothetical protein ABJ308_13250 [Halieaceae bacterium]
MPTRVIQWSSGNVGKALIRSIAQRDEFELAGLYVYSEDKCGQDAGDIVGIEALGVTASNDIEGLLAMDADVVIHTPLPSLIYGDDPDEDIKVVCRLLESGKNVITTVGYMYPKSHGPELVARLEEACRVGNSTFHSTGLNPGWMGDVLPLTMSALSSRIDQVYVREITNFEFYPSPEIMFDMMSFGKTEAGFAKAAERHQAWLSGLFRENIDLVADGLGVVLDEISEQVELAYAGEDLQTAAGLVGQGTVAGQHWQWSGIRNDRELIVHETVWRMHHSVAPDWPDGDHSVVIEGKPRMQVNFDAQWIDNGLLATAMHALNAVPHVLAAAPGIKTLLDLPWIMGRGAVRA